MIRRPQAPGMHPAPRATGSFTTILLGVAIATSAIRPVSGDPPAADPDPAGPPRRQVVHTLRLVHPGDASAKPAPHTLVQALDESGDPEAYAMWVDSVICRDEVCDIVKVRLHWDALGRYQRYEVAPGSQLTKLDHVPFTKADLARLQEILADPASPLKEVDKEAMTGTKHPASPPLPAGVDAVSSPTVLTLKSAVVVGAGYTCYDLWHWANGLLTDHIREFTGNDSCNRRLLAYLGGEDTGGARLALEHLAKRGLHDRATIDAVTAAGRMGHAALVKPTLVCLERIAPSAQVRDDAILDIFSTSGSKKRVLILEALLGPPRKPAPAFCDRLSDHLPDLDTYYEVHLFLTLMEQRNAASAKLTRKTAALLDHDKFFVSRRAYQHLAPQELPPKIRKRVEAYEDLHRDRL